MKQDGKQEMALRESRGAAAVELPEVNVSANKTKAEMQEDPSRYCPVCSHRLESKRCKLVCNTCGYYMSCADYY